MHRKLTESEVVPALQFQSDEQQLFHSYRPTIKQLFPLVPSDCFLKSKEFNEIEAHTERYKNFLQDFKEIFVLNDDTYFDKHWTVRTLERKLLAEFFWNTTEVGVSNGFEEWFKKAIQAHRSLTLAEERYVISKVFVNLCLDELYITTDIAAANNWNDILNAMVRLSMRKLNGFCVYRSFHPVSLVTQKTMTYTRM